MPVDIPALRKRMYDLAQSREYYMPLTDQERQSMELTAYNHFHYYGRKIRIAPRLFFDLANRGANMKYMEPDGSNEAWGARP